MALNKTNLASLVFGLCLLPYLVSYSQETGTDPLNTPPEKIAVQDAAEGAYSEDTIKAYAISTLKIRQVQLDMVPELESARNISNQKTLMQDMQDRMAKAIEQTEGMNIELYNTIAVALKTDKALSQRIKESIIANADADLSLDLFKGLKPKTESQ